MMIKLSEVTDASLDLTPLVSIHFTTIIEASIVPGFFLETVLSIVYTSY